MKPLGQLLATRLQREWYSKSSQGAAHAGGKTWPLLSLAVLPLSLLHRLLNSLRNGLYRLGLLRAESLPVPVVVVGNWIVGGAGKTPTTLALLTLCQQMGLRAGVISRGYGRKDDALALVTRSSSAAEVGDEPLLIHLRSGVPVAVGRDRVAAARALLHAHPELQLLVSDDGLQHLRLPRALAILVFDERGVGNGQLLPSGPLRQPATAAAKANEIVLYNAAAPSTALPGFLAQRRLSGAVALSDWWAGQPATQEALQALRTLPADQLLAAAGMAQPQRFFDMLSAQGLRFSALPLADHFDFATLPWPANTGHVLVTEKDAIKLDPARCGATQVWVVALDFCPEPAFAQAVQVRLAALGLRPH